MSFGSDLNHMLQEMPVSTHVHHRNLCKSLGNKSYSVILEESSQYINLQKGCHRQSSELPTNYSRASRIKNLYIKNLRNKICSFLRQNNLIESHIQKGLVHNISGTFEHTAHLAYVINNARVKQRSLHVTLLDLKNAFGEVNHNLLDCVFEYHHIPIKVRTLVRDLYTDFSTAIASDAFVTDFILVGRGVLQGDCLSPLAFNMVINTFIQFIKNEKYQQFGYNFIKYMIPRHLYQFADDAAVVTGLEHENQVLLNAFNSWCTWADMVIRVDKCHSFGMKKVGSSSRQYKPKLYINNELIPAIDINQSSFKYLGRHFD